MAEVSYTVVGPFVTCGVAPGGTIKGPLDPLLEQRLIDRGQIRVVKVETAAKTAKES